jgi:hypothetical protein
MSYPHAADHRIRRYTRGITVLGAVIAVMTVGAVVLPTVERENSLQTQRPWTSENPVDAVREPGGGVWTASGSARVTLPEELRNRPIELVSVERSESDVQAYLGDASDPHRIPEYLGNIWDLEPTPIASYADSELWIVAKDAWRLEILPLDVGEFVSPASGDSDAVLVYTGEATSGTVRWSGTGLLFAIARTVDGYQSLAVSGDGDPDAPPAPGSARFEWTASPFVVIEISAYDGIEWTLEVDESGPDAGVTPAPTSGVTPTPTSDTDEATP